ncbi:MAG: hypothetical protein K0S70_90 [Microbacterium sp.]|jgi:hypothetical protein|nr:hypothetical protein [Microbacterium sp.]
MSLAAAPRDASWWQHPDVHSFKVVHADNGDAFAQCNTGQPLCDSPRWEDAREVPAGARCRRRACAAAFAAADSGSTGSEDD